MGEQNGTGRKEEKGKAKGRRGKRNVTERMLEWTDGWAARCEEELTHARRLIRPRLPLAVGARRIGARSPGTTDDFWLD